MCKYLHVLICWALLSAAAMAQERQLQCSHFYIPSTQIPGEASSVAVNPTGSLVTCADKTDLIEIWDTQKGTLFASLKESDARFESVQFSPDGTMIVMGMSDGTVRRWSLENQQKLKSTKLHDAPVIDLRYSPDGTQIATIAKNDVTIVQDAKTGAKIERFEGNAASLAWSSDSKSLLIGGIDEIRLLDIDSGEVVLALEGADGAIGATAVHISADGKYAVAGHPGENFATVWELPTGKVRTKLVGHEDEITSITLGQDDSSLCTTSLDGTVRQWDASDGKLKSTQAGVSAILSRSRNNSSNLSVTGGEDGEILVWSADSIRGVLRSHKGYVDGLAFSSDGTQLSATVHARSEDEFQTRVTWPLGTGSITNEKLTVGELGNIQEQVVSKDSKLRARRNRTTIGISGWLDSQWSEGVVVQSQQYDFVGMQFIQEENSLVAANHSRLLRFDCTSGKETLKHETPLGDIRYFAASPSGKSAAIVSNACEMELYSFADEASKWKREVKVLADVGNPFEANYLDGIDFLTEDKLVLSADGALQIWSIDGAKVLFAQPVRNDVKITRVASCGDGNFVTITSEWKQGEKSVVMRLCTFDGRRVATVASAKLGLDEVSKLEVSDSALAILCASGAVLSWSLTNESHTSTPALAVKQRVSLTEEEQARLNKLLKDLNDVDTSISSKLDTIRSIGEMKEKAASSVDELAAHFPPKIEFSQYGEPKPSAQLAEALASCLAQIGEESVPHLVKVMRLKDPAYSYLGVAKLTELQKHAKSCGTELVATLKERLVTFSETQGTYQVAFVQVAIQNLYEMEIEPSIAVPLLTQMISAPSNVRHNYGQAVRYALEELKQFGGEAKSSTSALVKLLNESLVVPSNAGSGDYREAIEVLGAIGPDAEEALPTLRAILKSDKEVPRSLAQDAEQAIRLIKSTIE